MGATKPSWTKWGGEKNTARYQASWRGNVINIEVESVKDGIGTLRRVNSSVTPDFEEYGMQAVKDRVNEALIKYAKENDTVLDEDAPYTMNSK